MNLGMTSFDAQTIRLLRSAAHLLDYVVDAVAPVKWDRHRMESGAYPAQRDILEMFGQRGGSAETGADFDVAAAIVETARILATIPEESQTGVTQQLQGRVSSLERRAFVLLPAIRLG